MGKTTGSDLLIRALRSEGVDTVFGIAGDHILHMLDTMFDAPLRMVDFRHESGAVHAADSYSRILKKGAVMLSTTPGHANALPALANAIRHQQKEGFRRNHWYSRASFQASEQRQHLQRYEPSN